MEHRRPQKYNEHNIGRLFRSIRYIHTDRNNDDNMGSEESLYNKRTCETGTKRETVRGHYMPSKC